VNSLFYQLYRVKKKVLPGLNLRQFSIVQKFRDMLIASLRRSPVDVLGQKMFLDVRDSLDLALNRIYEPVETALLQRLIKPGDTIVDIGANIGYYSLIFARATTAAGQVFSFEPDPSNYSLLAQNLKLNGHSNVTAENCAVTAESKEIELFISNDSLADHRIYDSGDGRRSVKVPGVALDDYFAGKNVRIDLIKMDIQGAEFFAVQGMRRTLAKNRSVKLLTEFWPFGLKRAGVQAGDYLRLLEEIGLKITFVDEVTHVMSPANIDELVSRYSPEGPGYCNLLCEFPE
jgi:FkbM family methyltransferase